MRIDGPVVVAVDGAPGSERTLRWGVAAALRRGARLVVAHVAVPPVAWSWGGAPAVPPDDEGVLAELRAVCGQIARAHPGLHVQGVLLHGPTVPALTSYAADAQLLVAGTRDGRRAGRGVGRALSWRARCPVALVRARAAGDDEPAADLRPGPVVVGVDGTAASWLAAGLAAREALRDGRALHVLHAWRPGSDDAARQAAAELASDLAVTYPALVVRALLVEADPVDALVEQSRTAGLVVVGARRWWVTRGGVVGRRVAHRAGCPVLVVRDGLG
ncbi:universal stress protein [Cellulomonas sp. DKR-3]|uniref:Universal stress protein n=1 Tax=Cellulomonas fulva TaxID=2835530 RepID=A0ABS5U111_9CELL|nr:universal stress protein [Cellulomonas fulva]MBT0995095.1 universal stress protein [Cellulomonas fulva]